MRRVSCLFLIIVIVVLCDAPWSAVFADDANNTTPSNTISSVSSGATPPPSVPAPAASNSGKTLRPGELPANDPQQSDKRVVLNADRVSYDSDLDTATARGHVQLTQGLQVLTADVVTYNQDTDQVTASGNVILRDSTGDIFFGDYMELRNDMKDGFIDQVKGILVGDTRVIGNTATRRDDRYVDISNGTYSPCTLCKDDPNQPPIWQLKARQVEHDSDEQQLYYYDATLEFGGVPVMYTPYFSSPDPTVKQRDGFLAPEGGSSSLLGYTARDYYYYGISPQEDVTAQAGYASLQGPFVGAEWRDRLDYGKFIFSGSVAEGTDQYGDTKNLTTPDRTIRGHIFGLGIYDLDDNWRAGFNLARTSDDTYLREYGYSDQDLLDNRLYVEGFFDRNYAVANVYDAQDLRPGLIEGAQPLAAPYANYQAFGNQGETLGGRWDLNTGMMIITRPGGENLGTLGLTAQGIPVTTQTEAQLPKNGDQNVERVSLSTGWQRTIIADGISNEVDSHVFVDGYGTNNHPNLPEDPVDIDTGGDVAGRALPQFHDLASYPMISPTGNGHWLVQPMGSFSFAPNGLAENNKIPNEDSLDVELDTNNLFDANRFPGIDRIESGAHVAYGVKTGYYLDSGGYATLLFGQSRRLSGPNIFPTGSGLDTPASDYVAGVDIYPGKYVTVSYQTRLDHQTFGSKLHQVNLSFTPDPDKGETTIGANYLFLNSIPTINSGQNRNNLSPFISQKIGAYWVVTASITNEFGSMGRLQDVSTTATYTDDCLIFQIQGSRDLTNSAGGLAGTSIFFRVGLKTLGWFQSPNFAGMLGSLVSNSTSTTQ
jgi:LPS-assembly protein